MIRSGVPVHSTGITLLELMLALAINGVLLLGLIQLFFSSQRTFNTQRAFGDRQETGLYALQFLHRAVAQAGFVDDPWSGEELPPLTDDTGQTAAGSRLSMQRMSDSNCYGSLNPATDEAGRAAFYWLNESFERSADGRLRWTCRYGSTPAATTTQVNRQTVIDGVQDFQILLGQDIDGDDSVDRWQIPAGPVNGQPVIAVRIGLVLTETIGRTPFRQAPVSLFETTVDTPRDGRHRTALETTVVLWNGR